MENAISAEWDNKTTSLFQIDGIKQDKHILIKSVIESKEDSNKFKFKNKDQKG